MEDSAIIELYFERNENAISETDHKYGDYCCAIARNILSSRQDSEECVNDTWLRTWNTIPPQRPRVLRQFLAKITRNLSIDRYRAETAQKRGGGQTELALEELQECICVNGDPAGLMEMEVLKTAIGAFLKQLPDRERSIFLRRYFYVEDFAEIGQRYGLKDTNVRLILSRTRKKLAHHLQKEGLLE